MMMDTRAVFGGYALLDSLAYNFLPTRNPPFIVVLLDEFTPNLML
jgi:hypothetical protein